MAETTCWITIVTHAIHFFVVSEEIIKHLMWRRN